MHALTLLALLLAHEPSDRPTRVTVSAQALLDDEAVVSIEGTAFVVRPRERTRLADGGVLFGRAVFAVLQESVTHSGRDLAAPTSVSVVYSDGTASIPLSSARRCARHSNASTRSECLRDSMTVSR